MVRGSLAALVVAAIVDGYKQHLACHMKSGRHKTRDRKADVEAIVTVADWTNPFVPAPG